MILKTRLNDFIICSSSVLSGLILIPVCTFVVRRQVLKSYDSKPADPCQKQRWSLNNDGFISLKGTSLVLGLSDASNEVHSTVISI